MGYAIQWTPNMDPKDPSYGPPSRPLRVSVVGFALHHPVCVWLFIVCIVHIFGHRGHFVSKLGKVGFLVFFTFRSRMLHYIWLVVYLDLTILYIFC